MRSSRSPAPSWTRMKLSLGRVSCENRSYPRPIFARVQDGAGAIKTPSNRLQTGLKLSLVMWFTAKQGLMGRGGDTRKWSPQSPHLSTHFLTFPTLSPFTPATQARAELYFLQEGFLTKSKKSGLWQSLSKNSKRSILNCVQFIIQLRRSALTLSHRESQVGIKNVELQNHAQQIGKVGQQLCRVRLPLSLNDQTAIHSLQPILHDLPPTIHFL